MISALGPSPSYKDSGVESLGKVPAHWQVRQLKRICRMAYGDALASGVRQTGTIPVFGSNGQVGFHNAPNTSGPCVIVGRKGSFGKVHYSPDPVFAIDTTFYIDRHTFKGDVLWVSFLLGHLRLDAVTQDSTVPGLDRADAYKRLVPLPPIAEQAAIARFLDDADRRIRRYIHTKEKLVALLEEQKQAIIHRVVTGGLEAATELYGHAPERTDGPPAHWRRVTLRAATESIQTGPFGSQLHQSDYVTGGIPVVNPAHIASGRIESSPEVTVTDKKASQLRQHHLRPGDIVMARRGEMGRCAVVTEENADWLCGTGSVRIRPDASVLVAPYLVSVLGSAAGSRALTEVSVGTTMNNLSAVAVRSVRLFLPPVGEQRAIADYLDGKNAAVEASRRQIQKQIEHMSDYGTRLIADVVTGKLDVREAAGRLPDLNGSPPDVPPTIPTQE